MVITCSFTENRGVTLIFNILFLDGKYSRKLKETHAYSFSYMTN
jgi:hypothetical protein